MYKKIIITKAEVEELKKKDKKLQLLIDYVGDIDRQYIPDHFISLVHSIVFQQLAYKAAISIWNRFVNEIGEITPNNILNIDESNLRQCGLSSSKIKYIKNISKAIIGEELEIEKFCSMSDGKIIEQLIRIKGIGEWTAEMFLITSLVRKDVLSYKDLGIRKGMQWLYGLKEEPTKEQFEKYRKKFSPYNTLASFYLWEVTSRNLTRFKSVEKVKLEGEVIYYDSPIGMIELQSSNDYIISLNFVEEKLYDEENSKVLLEAQKQLDEYFCGNRKEFDLPVKLAGTDFQKKVWQELKNIQYGEVASYKDIAVKINNPKGCRAVGNANNKNKIGIVLPCHRVVGSNGKLVGYAGGVWRKEWLLNHEKKYKKR